MVLARFLAVVFLTTAAFAQTFNGALAGVATDTSGAVLPGASVNLQNPATGRTLTTTSSANGDFLFVDLPVGLYTLTVSNAGFQTKRIDNIEIAVSKTTNITVQLSVAQQQSTVEVAASAVSVDTTSSALTSVVNTSSVQDMPMNGRNFLQMVKLVPGASPLASSINGSRTTGSNYQIDGADNNDAFQNVSAVNQGGVAGIAGTLLPIEAIDQFAVEASGGPDQGRNAGAQVNVVLKSGTNDFHGSLFYFNRNEALASRSPLLAPTSPKQVIRNNQFGFSAGGPIIKNKTFFFLAGEAQLALADDSILTTEPSTAWVNQAEGVLAKYNVPVNPVSLNLLTIWPADVRNGPATTNNFLSNGQNTYNSYNGVMKIDHRFNASNSMFVRYFVGTGTQTANIGSDIPQYFQVAPSHMHNMAIADTAILSPRMVNLLTLGVNYFFQSFNNADNSVNPIALGLNTGITSPVLLGSPKITITGFDYVGATSPEARIDTTGHLTDTLSYNVGRHAMIFGGEFRRAVLDVGYDINERGSFTFDGSRGPWSSDPAVTGDLRTLSDFLAGYPSNSNGATIAEGPLQRLYLQNSFDLWAGDTFRLNSRLTLNYGARYTYQGVLHDSRDSITNFIPGDGFVVPNVSGAGPLYPKDYHDLAPRVGFAYTATSDGKTVIRGGYGIYYDVPALNFFTANTSLSNGGAAGVNANPGGPNPVYNLSVKNVVFSPGVALFGSSTPTPPFGAFAVNQNFRTAYSQNFDLNIQRQLSQSTLLQIGYVGTLGRKLPVLLDINQPILTNGVAVRPYAAEYPQLATIDTAESIANSEYNALQVSLRQRLWKGLSATANYGYGHSIDDSSAVRNTVPTDSYNLHDQRGSSSFDVRNMSTDFITYELPQLGKFAPRLTKGWQLNSLFTFSTGQPINILAGTNVSGTGENQDRVDVIGNPFANVPVIKGPAVQYLNPAAFAKPASGTFGDIGRDLYYGPGFGSVDFSIFKRTPITERISTEFRVEIFNLFNRTNWANPNATFSSSSFGQLTQTFSNSSAPGLGVGEPRNTQLALKIIW
ncbi:MAG TPA: TonB-dependent receptor [Bryobacteraceae bacterium]|nr:TonB-dependent receptor [Bryobacteraceae bacterium]